MGGGMEREGDGVSVWEDGRESDGEEGGGWRGKGDGVSMGGGGGGGWRDECMGCGGGEVGGGVSNWEEARTFKEGVRRRDPERE